MKLNSALLKRNNSDLEVQPVAIPEGCNESAHRNGSRCTQISCNLSCLLESIISHSEGFIMIQRSEPCGHGVTSLLPTLTNEHWTVEHLATSPISSASCAVTNRPVKSRSAACWKFLSGYFDIQLHVCVYTYYLFRDVLRCYVNLWNEEQSIGWHCAVQRRKNINEAKEV